MKVSGERYSPQINNAVLGPFEPFISYEHWHRYCYAAPFAAGKTVLDIASGEGYGSAFLAARAAHVYGVDVSEEAVRHARQTYTRDNLCFLHGSAGEIPILGQHCLDAIVSFETIEHLDADTQQRFAREAKRLLKPDGVLLISTPNRLVYTEAIDHHNPYHLREFTGDEFLQFLHDYFAQVQMLSQRVYPCSYIWNVAERSRDTVEYQIALEGGEFRPREVDAKEIRYLIAVCSNREQPLAALDSVMLDVSEVAFRGVPGRERWHDTSLFLDSGAGYRAEEMVCEKVEYTPDFRVTFTLDPSLFYREMRWDPLELRLCTVRLRSVEWRDGAGQSHQLDLDKLWSPSERSADGDYRFDTSDPMIVLRITGSVASVTIEGECVVESEADSLRRMDARLASRGDELRCLRHRLEESERRSRQREQELQDALNNAPHRPLPHWVRSALSFLRRAKKTG